MVDKLKNFQVAFAEFKQDYLAASNSRFIPKLKGVAFDGSGADYHYRRERDYLLMLERSRALERDDMVVGSGINRATSNIYYGDGYNPDPATGNKDLDARIKDRWLKWTTSPDACHSEKEFTFHAISRLVVRSIIRDGDVFAMFGKNGSLQLVEGHRPRTPKTKRNVVNGILLSDAAERNQVWFSAEDLGTTNATLKVSDIRPYNFRDADGNRQILQCYLPKRLSQRRGISALAPVTQSTVMWGDNAFAQTVKAQMGALLCLVETQGMQQVVGGGLGTSGIMAGGAVTGQNQETTLSNIPGLVAGLHYKVAPGGDIRVHSSNTPDNSFFNLSNFLLSFIAIALDVPMCVMLLDATNTNFSSFRGAMAAAAPRIREIQGDIISQFHDPVYRWKVRNWIETDPEIARLAMQEGVDPYAVNWQISAPPYLDPSVDAKSDGLIIQNFLNSPRRIQSARGRDWNDVAGEIVVDKGLLIELAIQEAERINKAYPGAEISWREILGPGLTFPIDSTFPNGPQLAQQPSATGK